MTNYNKRNLILFPEKIIQIFNAKIFSSLLSPVKKQQIFALWKKSHEFFKKRS